MAKKTKQQKRKDKLTKRKTSKQIHNKQMDSVFVDKNKIALSFPDKEKRIEYIQTLIDDFDEQLKAS